MACVLSTVELYSPAVPDGGAALESVKETSAVSARCRDNAQHSIVSGPLRVRPPSDCLRTLAQRSSLFQQEKK